MLHTSYSNTVGPMGRTVKDVALIFVCFSCIEVIQCVDNTTQQPRIIIQNFYLVLKNFELKKTQKNFFCVVT